MQPLVFAQRLVTDDPDEVDAQSQHELNVGMIVVEMRRVDRVIMADERKPSVPSDSGVTFHQELADVKVRRSRQCVADIQGALGDVAACVDALDTARLNSRRLGDAIQASHNTDQCEVVINASDAQPWKVVCFHYRSRGACKLSLCRL